MTHKKQITRLIKGQKTSRTGYKTRKNKRSYSAIQNRVYPRLGDFWQTSSRVSKLKGFYKKYTNRLIRRKKLDIQNGEYKKVFDLRWTIN